MKPNKTVPYVIIIVIVLTALIYIFNPGSIIPISKTLSVGLETKIQYMDGTSEIINQVVSPASIYKNNKAISSIIYNPYFISETQQKASIIYNVVSDGKSIDSKTSEISLSSEKSYLQPITIDASKISNDIYLELFINNKKLRSEILIFEHQKTIDGNINLANEPTPTPTPYQTFTPVPTPSPISTPEPTPLPTPETITCNGIIQIGCDSPPTPTPTPTPTQNNILTYSLILIEIKGGFSVT